MIILEVLVIALLPACILKLIKRFPVLQNIGAVALCYFCGFIFSILPVSYDKGLSQTLASVLVAIAIPLILFSFDLRSIRSLAKNMLAGYGLQIISAIICSAAGALIAARAGLANAAQLAGMTTGLYTGGTPNLIAIGSALLPASVSAEVITAASTADFLVGGLYFMLLVTVMRTVYRRFLGDKKVPEAASVSSRNDQAALTVTEYDYSSIPKDRRSIMRLISAVLLAVLCLAAGAGLEYLINGSLDGSLYIMITVSVLGILASFVRPIREIQGSYQIGQYLVLMFSLGLSMSIDLKVLAKTLLPTFMFFAVMQVSCILIHLLLCRLFRVDGGAAIITNTAGIYGPPFIAPVADAYGDRQLIAPGIICAVTGLVIGNLLGIAVGSLLSQLLL